jgi:hypothetical protein
VSADPWRDLPVENHGVRVIVTERHTRREQGEQARQDRQRHAQECADEWRDFSQQPGTHLRLVRAGVVRRELRTTEQQTVASLRGLQPSAVSVDGRPLQPSAVSVGGRPFAWKEVSGSSWLGIAEFVRASHQEGDREHFLVADSALQQISQGKANSRKPDRFIRGILNLGELFDQTGIPILYTSGTNYSFNAGARITFPDQRWLQFPVRGTGSANAIMTAVDQAGKKIVRYRVIGKLRGTSLWNTMEITIHPSQPLADELVLAIAMSTPWLDSYYVIPNQGGGG